MWHEGRLLLFLYRLTWYRTRPGAVERDVSTAETRPKTQYGSPASFEEERKTTTEDKCWDWLLTRRGFAKAQVVQWPSGK